MNAPKYIRVAGRLYRKVDKQVHMAAPGYATLSDAADATDRELYGHGSTEVWYMRPEMFSKLNFGPGALKPDQLAAIKNDPSKTHILLGNVNEQNPDVIWGLMQGEYWSPNGEANSLLRKLGLSHTSMSVGDIIKYSDGRVMMVDGLGFKEL